MKSIHQNEYKVMCELLREYREKSRLTQDELSDLLSDGTYKLHKNQISLIERGQRRLDALELRMICRALGISFSEFVIEFERRLSSMDS